MDRSQDRVDKLNQADLKPTEDLDLENLRSPQSRVTRLPEEVVIAVVEHFMRDLRTQTLVQSGLEPEHRSVLGEVLENEIKLLGSLVAALDQIESAPRQKAEQMSLRLQAACAVLSGDLTADEAKQFAERALLRELVESRREQFIDRYQIGVSGEGQVSLDCSVPRIEFLQEAANLYQQLEVARNPAARRLERINFSSLEEWPGKAVLQEAAQSPIFVGPYSFTEIDRSENFGPDASSEMRAEDLLVAAAAYLVVTDQDLFAGREIAARGGYLFNASLNLTMLRQDQSGERVYFRGW